MVTAADWWASHHPGHERWASLNDTLQGSSRVCMCTGDKTRPSEGEPHKLYYGRWKIWWRGWWLSARRRRRRRCIRRGRRRTESYLFVICLCTNMKSVLLVFQSSSRSAQLKSSRSAQWLHACSSVTGTANIQWHHKCGHNPFSGCCLLISLIASSTPPKRKNDIHTVMHSVQGCTAEAAEEEEEEEEYCGVEAINWIRGPTNHS